MVQSITGRNKILELSDQISAISFLPVNTGGDFTLLAVATSHTLYVFAADSTMTRLEEIQQYNLTGALTISTSPMVNAISWSLASKYRHHSEPPIDGMDGPLICLALACSDNQIRICSNENILTKELGDFNRSLRDCAFNYNSNVYEPFYIAAVGEDKTCSILELTMEQEYHLVVGAVVKLSSPGIAVRWSTFANDILMVAERSGSLRLYNLNKKAWIFSFYSNNIGKDILLSADWSFSDPTLLGAVISGKWYLWQVGVNQNKIQLPSSEGEIPEMESKKLRFTRRWGNLYATLSRAQKSSSAIHVLDASMPFATLSSMGFPSVITSFEWHPREKGIVACGKNCIFWWHI